jgi:predicted GNAT family acetyltransferase
MGPMAAAEDAVTIVDNGAENRFETTVDGHRAELVYHLNGKRLVLIHTGVPDELGSRGIGGQLVEAALEKAVAADLTVVPKCPFARSWLQKHPEAAARARIDWPTES